MFNFGRKKVEESMGAQAMTQDNETHQAEVPMDAAFSTRSRASLVREAHLRAEIQRIAGMKAGEERVLARLDADAIRLQDGDISSSGNAIIHENLIHKRMEIGAHRETLKGYEEAATAREQAIAKLNPSTAEINARTDVQRKAAALVCARAETDTKIDAAVTLLRQLLKGRAQQTSDLADAVGTLALALPPDGLDSQRFEMLLGSLPEDVGSQSEQWAGRFMGRPKGGKPYIVRAENLAVTETLAHAGIYKFGEVIVLGDDEARELLADDYAAPAERAPWRRLWPRIMTVEAFERVKTAAEEKSLAPIEIVFAEDLARDCEDRRYWASNQRRSPVSKRQSAAPANAVEFQSGLRISVKALRRIAGPRVGEMNQPGDVIESIPLAQAWELAEDEAIAAL